MLQNVFLALTRILQRILDYFMYSSPSYIKKDCINNIVYKLFHCLLLDTSYSRLVLYIFILYIQHLLHKVKYRDPL